MIKLSVTIFFLSLHITDYFGRNNLNGMVSSTLAFRILLPNLSERAEGTKKIYIYNNAGKKIIIKEKYRKTRCRPLCRVQRSFDPTPTCTHSMKLHSMAEFSVS